MWDTRQDPGDTFSTKIFRWFIWKCFHWSRTVFSVIRFWELTRKKDKKDFWGQIGGNITLLPLLITHMLLIMRCVLKWWLAEWGTERKLENAKMIKGFLSFFFFFCTHECPHVHKREQGSERDKRNLLEVFLTHPWPAPINRMHKGEIKSTKPPENL